MSDERPQEISRREALARLAAVPAAAATARALPVLGATTAALAAAAGEAQAEAAPPAPRFFTAHELATVTMLADYLIPRDAQSGSASDAGVPAWLDWKMTDEPSGQTPMRGGLAWLDTTATTQFGVPFVQATDAQRRALLDQIAWPSRATPPMQYGAAFFDRLRSLVATAFYSSKVGMADLQYLGNTAVPEWRGCPPQQLARLGVRYED